jgi:hypothetical protein
MKRCTTLTIAAFFCASVASAQDAPPRGPAEVITRAQQAGEAEARARAAGSTGGALPAGHPEVAGAADGELPPGHPEVAGAADGELPPGHPTVGAEQAERALREPEVAVAQPSADVPAGEIRITVVDPDGRPAAGAPVRLGIMAQGGERESKAAETDAEGRARFTDLPVGSGQAYRVNVLHEGATYSSTPFRLEADRGHLVRVLRFPVTHDPRALLQWIGGSFLELKPERLHVIQQAELVNLAGETYVFPEDGLKIELPEGFTAFQSQPMMTDQRIAPNDDGFALMGSLPPGRITLTWAFDVPLDGATLTFGQPMPFRTYQYVVASDAAPGLELDVDGFPAARRDEGQGRPHLATRIQRSPNDPPWERLRITLRGIPGPGPYRYVAIGLALAFLFLAGHLATREKASPVAEARARKARRRALLEEARELEAAFGRDEIGPRYHERRRREIVDELALLLKMDRAEGEKRGGRAASAGAPAGPR